MQVRKFGPYLAATNRVLISAMNDCLSSAVARMGSVTVRHTEAGRRL
jgi:hypothetical protein